MPTVLIVEDEGLLALDLEEWIEVESDLHAVSVPSVVDAEKAMQGAFIEFVLLDINVLDGNTFGFARELLFHHIPFAFTSGNDPDLIPRDLQAVPFISKPYGRRAVMAAVRDGLAKSYLKLG